MDNTKGGPDDETSIVRITFEDQAHLIRTLCLLAEVYDDAEYWLSFSIVSRIPNIGGRGFSSFKGHVRFKDAETAMIAKLTL